MSEIPFDLDEYVVVVRDRSVLANEKKILDGTVKTDTRSNREALASQGIRVLAVAHKFSHQPISSDFTDGVAPGCECFERDLIFTASLLWQTSYALSSLTSLLTTVEAS